jgi:putative FmdB family regulatory protein
MPTYEHLCQACNNEWEDEYSIKADPPKFCPKCGAESVKRLISLGGKGVVELNGHELVEKLKGDAQQIKKEASRSDKVYANLLGESRYNDLQTRLDRRKR